MAAMLRPALLPWTGPAAAARSERVQLVTQHVVLFLHERGLLVDKDPAALSDESVAGNTDLEFLFHGDAHFPE